MTDQYYQLQLLREGKGWGTVEGEYDSPEQIEEELLETIARFAGAWRIVEVSVTETVVRKAEVTAATDTPTAPGS